MRACERDAIGVSALRPGKRGRLVRVETPLDSEVNFHIFSYVFSLSRRSVKILRLHTVTFFASKALKPIIYDAKFYVADSSCLFLSLCVRACGRARERLKFLRVQRLKHHPQVARAHARTHTQREVATSRAPRQLVMERE